MNTTPHSRKRAPRFPAATNRTSRCKRLAGALLAAAVAMISAGPAVASAQAAPTPTISAMNGWSLHGLSPAQLNTQLAIMAGDGVQVLRDDASWSSIEASAARPRRTTLTTSRPRIKK